MVWYHNTIPKEALLPTDSTLLGFVRFAPLCCACSNRNTAPGIIPYLAAKYPNEAYKRNPNFPIHSFRMAYACVVWRVGLEKTLSKMLATACLANVPENGVSVHRTLRSVLTKDESVVVCTYVVVSSRDFIMFLNYPS